MPFSPTGIYSHVTVLDVNSNVLYIYGGYAYFLGKMGVSNNMFVVDPRNGSKFASWYHVTPYTPTQVLMVIFHSLRFNSAAL